MAPTNTLCYDSVKAFMVAMQTFDSPHDVTLASLRMGLILEELSETERAMRAGDVLETADGLADLLYVVVGCGVAYRVNVVDCLESADNKLITPSYEHALDLSNKTLTAINSLLRSIQAQDRDAMAYALMVLVTSINFMANKLGIPLREVFMEVHRSNMSKEFGPAIGGDPAKRGVKGKGYSKPDIQGTLLKYANMALN